MEGRIREASSRRALAPLAASLGLHEPADSEVSLDNGTDVVDAAMNKIGVVDDILFDEDGKIEGFIVQQGHVFHHDVRVPMEWVAGITHEHVRLNVLKDEVAKSKA